jgi:hypothetical protein
MMNKKSTGSIIVASILSCILLFTVIFFRSIDIYFKGVNYILSGLLVLALFIVMIILLISNLISFFRNKPNLKPAIYAPSVIYTITFFLTFIFPTFEKFKSKPLITAYFKGTQNQANITLRANRSFELNWSGVFGYNEWFTGNYRQSGDTLFLKYDGTQPYRFGKKILVKEGVLITLDKAIDSTQYFVPFYVSKGS